MKDVVKRRVRVGENMVKGITRTEVCDIRKPDVALPLRMSLIDGLSLVFRSNRRGYPVVVLAAGSISHYSHKPRLGRESEASYIHQDTQNMRCDKTIASSHKYMFPLSSAGSQACGHFDMFKMEAGLFLNFSGNDKSLLALSIAT